VGATTGIAWTDATWNCWQGCHKVSAGCKNCYMFADKKRYGQNPGIVVRSAAVTFNAPLRWAADRQKFGHINRVFVDSWSDFFIAEADAWRDEAWAIIRETPNLTYQICTKRPERIAACLPADWGHGYPNVWMGVTTENQAETDERIPILLQTPAVVRFLSCEPLLGPVSLRWKNSTDFGTPHLRHKMPEPDERGRICTDEYDGLREVDWVICGGESGPGARPMHPDWARALRDQCRAAGVPYFFKQWGEWTEVGGGAPHTLHEVMGHGGIPCDQFNCVMAEDGHIPARASEMRGDVKYRWLSRVGKKVAGSLLDGVEHNAFPAVRG